MGLAARLLNMPVNEEAAPCLSCSPPQPAVLGDLRDAVGAGAEPGMLV